jgi:hypothetical protein
MLRKVGLIAAAALLLAACGDHGGGAAYKLVEPQLMQVGIDGRGQNFSYTHRLELVLADGGVKASFELARETCLKQAALKCDLLSASLTAGETTSYGQVVVALPHDKVATFEKTLTDAGATVQSRSTNAENVTTAAGDNERKIVQLTAWRDRLAALAKRNDLSVSDLMKVEAELSKVEADLSAALAEKRDITNRIAKEILTISFGEREGTLAPVGRVLTNAGTTLVSSTATAVEFLIRIVPWLPIILAGLWLVRWIWSKRKKAD